MGLLQKNMYKLVEQAGRKALYQSDEVEWKILSVSSNKKTNPHSRADMLTQPPLEEFELKDNILCAYFTFRNNILSPWGISKAKYFSFMRCCFLFLFLATFLWTLESLIWEFTTSVSEENAA